MIEITPAATSPFRLVEAVTATPAGKVRASGGDAP
jgi:hypothetical protein